DDAEALERGRAQGLAVVGLEARHLAGADLLLQQLPAALRAPVGEAETLVPGQIPGLLRCAGLPEVVWRSTDAEREQGKLARDQRRIGQFADADGNVDAFIDDINEAVGQRQIDIHLRMLLQVIAY